MSFCAQLSSDDDVDPSVGSDQADDISKSHTVSFYAIVIVSSDSREASLLRSNADDKQCYCREVNRLTQAICWVLDGRVQIRLLRPSSLGIQQTSPGRGLLFLQLEQGKHHDD